MTRPVLRVLDNHVTYGPKFLGFTVWRRMIRLVHEDPLNMLLEILG